MRSPLVFKPDWEKMPFNPLLQRLGEKTNQRIFRTDDSFPKAQPSGMSGADWKAFQATYEEDKLYFQTTVSDKSNGHLQAESS